MPATTKPKGANLGQTEIWIDQRGKGHRIDEMSVRYKTNVVNFLDRRAPSIVRKAAARAAADRLMKATSRLFEPMPCVQCEGLDGDGTMKVERWAHGVDHAPYDVDKYPAETDAMVDQLWDDLFDAAPSYTDAEAIELVRQTPLVQRLLDDIAANRGGQDG